MIELRLEERPFAYVVAGTSGDVARLTTWLDRPATPQELAAAVDEALAILRLESAT